MILILADSHDQPVRNLNLESDLPNDDQNNEIEIEDDSQTEIPILSEQPSNNEGQQLSRLFEQDVKSLEDAAESSRRVYR